MRIILHQQYNITQYHKNKTGWINAATLDSCQYNCSLPDYANVVAATGWDAHHSNFSKKLFAIFCIKNQVIITGHMAFLTLDQYRQSNWDKILANAKCSAHDGNIHGKYNTEPEDINRVELFKIIFLITSSIWSNTAQNAIILTKKTDFSQLEITWAFWHDFSQVRNPCVDLVTSPSFNCNNKTSLPLYRVKYIICCTFNQLGICYLASEFWFWTDFKDSPL